MNTEITDKEVIGWVYYDADCALCVSGVRRWGPVFARRGFVWLPIQTPGAAAQLGIRKAELLGEMKLRCADSRVLGGVDSWALLFRSVWWLWLPGALLALPGLRALGAAAYRWVARNRYCLDGACAWPAGRIPEPPTVPPAPCSRKARHHGTTTFWDMP